MVGTAKNCNSPRETEVDFNGENDSRMTQDTGATREPHTCRLYVEKVSLRGRASVAPRVVPPESSAASPYRRSPPYCSSASSSSRTPGRRARPPSETAACRARSPSVSRDRPSGARCATSRARRSPGCPSRPKAPPRASSRLRPYGPNGPPSCSSCDAQDESCAVQKPCDCTRSSPNSTRLGATSCAF